LALDIEKVFVRSSSSLFGSVSRSVFIAYSLRDI